MSRAAARWAAALGALASHWRRRPLQAAAALLGLALATALWSGVQALNGEAKRAYAEAAAVLEGDRIDRLEPVAEGRLDVATYAALRRAGLAVSPVIEGSLGVGGRRLRLVGVEPLTLPRSALGEALQADGPDIAAFTGPPWAMLASAETLDRLGIAPGSRGRADDGRALPPAVAADRLAPDLLLTDIGAAAALLGPGLTALLIDPEAPASPVPWQEIAGDRLVLVPAAGESGLDGLTGSFHLNLTAFGFLAFAVGLLITHAAVGLAFEQRLGLIRTLRACGVSAREVAGLLLAELALGAALAGALGLVGGWLVAGLLMPGVSATLSGLFGAPVSGGLSLAPGWWVQGLAMSLAGAAIAAGHTLARAYALPPLASARRQDWAASGRRTRRLEAALGLAALAAGAAVWGFGSGLVAGFALMAAMMLAAVLLLPALLAWLLARAARLARGPVAEWAVADSRQQIPGLSLALMALLLALAANIGVGTMVESFRTTFVDWLERRLVADIYVSPARAEQEAPLGAWLAARPETAELLGLRRTEIRLGAERLELMGRPAAPAYREGWPLLEAAPGAWDRLAEGTGLLVSEQLSRRMGLGLGDAVVLPAPGGAWPVAVVGIYADYGNPRGEATVGLAAMEARWPGARFDGYGVRLVPGTDTGPVMAAIEAAFGLGPDELVDNAGVRRFSLRVFERTFAVTAMLNLFTLGVAGVALFASLLTLSDLRLASLAPVWAAGVPRRRLAALELGKTLALALLTAVLAIPLGLGLAWLLVAVINVEAFGWRLPLHLFPGQWLWLIGLTAVTALAAAALPMLRLARLPAARLAKIFAEER